MAMGLAKGDAPRYESDLAANPGFALLQVCVLGLVTSLL